MKSKDQQLLEEAYGQTIDKTKQSKQRLLSRIKPEFQKLYIKDLEHFNGSYKDHTDFLSKAQEMCHLVAEMNKNIDDLAAAPHRLTPEVIEYVLNLMAQKEGMSVEAYLTVAKEALGIADIDMSDEELAEKLVQRTLNNMSSQNVDKIVSLAARKKA